MAGKDLEKDSLVKSIKEKIEFRGLPDHYVRESLNEYITKKRIDISAFSKKEQKLIVKEVRAQLRLVTGRFQKNLRFRKKLSETNSFSQVLQTHSSTRERIAFYPNIIKLIKQLKVRSILDLGCGLNPIALGKRKIIYYASDIKEDELELIREFFLREKIIGRVFFYDLRKIKKDLPSAELCLVFKVLEVIAGTRSERISLAEKIIESVSCKYFLISFPTRKLSGKKMAYPARIWFEKILIRKHLTFKKIFSPNEIFYFVKELDENHTS